MTTPSPHVLPSDSMVSRSLGDRNYEFESLMACEEMHWHSKLEKRVPSPSFSSCSSATLWETIQMVIREKGGYSDALMSRTTHTYSLPERKDNIYIHRRNITEERPYVSSYTHTSMHARTHARTYKSAHSKSLPPMTCVIRLLSDRSCSCCRLRGQCAVVGDASQSVAT